MQILDEGRSSRNNAPGDKRAAGAGPLDGADVANKSSWELRSGLCRGVCQATSNQVRLDNIGLDVNTYSKLFSGNPSRRVRDVLWGEFNRRSVDYYTKGMTEGDFRDYCELLRTMALFLEEENRHKDALIRLNNDFLYHQFF